MKLLPVTRSELRRLAKDPALLAAVCAVLLVPLLYGAVYLWAFWDPYSHVDALPVALVVQDHPASVDGETLTAGRDLAEELLDTNTFAWREVSADTAAQGLANGTYYMTLTVPADFSAKLASAQDARPAEARLIVAQREGSNYLASQIGARVFSEIRAAASASASKSYVDQMLVGFTDAHASLEDASLGANNLADGIKQAAVGAQELADGSHTASDGAADLASGTGKLAKGAARLDSGASSLSSGASALRSGLVTASSGSKTAAAGASSLADGTQALSTGLQATSTGAAAVSAGTDRLAGSSADLAGGISRLQAGSKRLAAGTDELSSGSAQLKAGVDAASSKLENASQSSAQLAQAAAGLDGALSAFVSSHPEYAEELGSARGLSGKVKGGAAQLANGLADAAKDAPALAQGAKQVAEGAASADDGASELAEGLTAAAAGSSALSEGAGSLNRGAKDLTAGVSKASGGSAELASGAKALSSGSGSLARGLDSALVGSTRLAAGTRKLATGAHTLHAGTAKAADGSHELSAGVAKVAAGASTLASGLEPAADGSEELASGLTAGVEDLPSYSAASRTRHSAMMSDPVRLETTAVDAVPNYGTGFAPYFMPISLWVGLLVTFLIVTPLPKSDAKTTPARRALGGWLTGSIIGLVQASLLLLVVVRALGLSAIHPVWTWAIVLATAVVFAAIQQLLAASLGPAGKFLGIVLLVLQLTSASGTFPIEMQPAFFKAIHPLLPMSYVVSGLRLAVSGGSGAAFGADLIALLGFGAVALVGTVLVARAGGSPLERRLASSIDI